MKDCIFCKIVNGDIPAMVVYEDEEILAFHDLDKQAPEHVLVIPKRHIASLDDVSESEEDKALLGHIMAKVHIIAGLLGIVNGYRLVCNNGKDGQQTVGHLHFHLLGKRKMTWPPG
jgi:histidine triad (HIT) family protein